MSPTKSALGLWQDVLSFEQQLRTGASRSRAYTSDPELARILASVGQRRRSRSTGVRTPTLEPTARVAEPGTVLEIERIGTSVAILRVARAAGMHFQAGQHLKLGFPNGARNPYTIASAPSNRELEFCIELVPGGRVSSQLLALRAGAQLDIEGKPKGDFVLQPGADIHLMFATVTGIAPFRSMLREAAAQNRWSRFIVMHGASFADELVYRTELEELAKRHSDQLRYIPSVSRPSDPRNREFSGLTGRLTEHSGALARELQATGQRIQVYACGHPEMVQAIHNELGAMGLPVASEVFD